jgi:hypothetical protein
VKLNSIKVTPNPTVNRNAPVHGPISGQYRRGAPVTLIARRHEVTKSYAACCLCRERGMHGILDCRLALGSILR